MGIDSISMQPANTTGIIANDFGKALQLYPNPTKGNFSIDLGEKYESISLTIRDLQGSIVQAQSYNNRQVLNLSLEEAAGVYLLVVESETKKATLRLIKE